MMSLTRRQLVVVLLVVVTILLLFSSTPRSTERASSLSAAGSVPWSWSSTPKAPELNVLPSTAPDTRITETVLPPGAQTSGFTLYERLYVWNGTLYVVTSDKGMHPPLLHVLSKGKDKGTAENIDPTDKEMQVITPEEAKHILGSRAVVIEGMSFIMYDTRQFMAHYYHWWGEIMLGAMRVYSALSFLPTYKDTALPEPARFILPNVVDKGWRDKAGVNGPLMRAAFPSAAIERIDFWEDLMDVDRTFVFEKAMIVSRVAAHKHPLSSVWYKMISSTMNITAAPYFWEPLRQRVVRNVLGYLPVPSASSGIIISRAPPNPHPHPAVTPSKPNPQGSKLPQSQPRPEELALLGSAKPLVIYVSRQGAGRRLTDDDNMALEEAMRALEREGLCEVFVARMEEWGMREQVEGVARSTIMVGVHGNGLTHQIWMPPSRRSTVIEIFYPETFLHDYSMLARNMGHKHYAIWNDTALSYPDGQWYEGVNGGTRDNFHGNAIPVHGPTVAGIIRKRLTENV